MFTSSSSDGVFQWSLARFHHQLLSGTLLRCKATQIFSSTFPVLTNLESRAHWSLSFHQIFTNNLLSTWANANGAMFLLIDSQSGKKYHHINGLSEESLEQIEDQTLGTMITFQIWLDDTFGQGLWFGLLSYYGPTYGLGSHFSLGLCHSAQSQKKRMWPTYDIIRILHCLKGTCCHILIWRAVLTAFEVSNLKVPTKHLNTWRRQAPSGIDLTCAIYSCQ